METLKRFLPVILAVAAIAGLYFNYMTHKKLTGGCSCQGAGHEAESAYNML